jgi:hypothetical protein
VWPIITIASSQADAVAEVGQGWLPAHLRLRFTKREVFYCFGAAGHGAGAGSAGAAVIGAAAGWAAGLAAVVGAGLAAAFFFAAGVLTGLGGGGSGVSWTITGFGRISGALLDCAIGSMLSDSA